MTPGTQSYPPPRPGQQQGAVYDWNKGGASFGRIGLRGGAPAARPQGGFPGKPGQAQPMRPQASGTPYAPYNRPSIGGWPDPSGTGRRPMNQGAVQTEGRYGPGTTQAYMDANPDDLFAAGTTQAYADAHPDTIDFAGAHGEYAGAGQGPFDFGRPGQDQRQPGGQDPFTFGFNGGQVAQTMPSFQKGAGAGNLAYASPGNRPQPFTQSMNFMGQKVDPGQYYGQRDAFISNINGERAKFAQNPTEQRQPLNFGAMWGQAGDMVQQGWRNPLQGLYQ